MEAASWLQPLGKWKQKVYFNQSQHAVWMLKESAEKLNREFKQAEQQLKEAKG